MPQKFNHVMVKLETASTEYNAGILCIAAVKFNLDASKETEEFVIYIDPTTFKNYYISVDAHTLRWVKDNRPEVWSSCRSSDNGVDHGLYEFQSFLGATVTDNEIWGNGMDFVFPVLKSSFKAVDMPLPYKFYKTRDLRTVLSLSGTNAKDFLDDSMCPLEICRQQVTMLKHVVGLGV